MNRLWIQIEWSSAVALDRLVQRTAAKLGGGVEGHVLQTYTVADGDKSGTTRRLGGQTNRALLAFRTPDGDERRCRAWTFSGSPYGDQRPRWKLADNAWWMLREPAASESGLAHALQLGVMHNVATSYPAPVAGAICSTDGDVPFGKCTRAATTTRDFVGNGTYDPCCDKCAAFWDWHQEHPGGDPAVFDATWAASHPS